MQCRSGRSLPRTFSAAGRARSSSSSSSEEEIIAEHSIAEHTVESSAAVWGKTPGNR